MIKKWTLEEARKDYKEKSLINITRNKTRRCENCKFSYGDLDDFCDVKEARITFTIAIALTCRYYTNKHK